MKTLTKSIVLLLVLLVSGLCRAEHPHGLPDGLYTEITTERGVVVCELFYEKMPMTVVNHVALAEGALGPKPRQPFYQGLTWCRVVPGFVVQGGDPQGTGEGGAGYLFPDEIVPGLRHEGLPWVHPQQIPNPNGIASPPPFHVAPPRFPNSPTSQIHPRPRGNSCFQQPSSVRRHYHVSRSPVARLMAIPWEKSLTAYAVLPPEK